MLRLQLSTLQFSFKTENFLLSWLPAQHSIWQAMHATVVYFSFIDPEMAKISYITEQLDTAAP